MPGFEHLSFALIAWIVAVMLLSGFVQGALGLGFPTVATPLIALVTDIRSAVILVLLPCVATIIVSIWTAGPLRRVLAEFWMMPLYMLIGGAIGARLFIAYPGFPYPLLLAVVIFVYLNLERLGRREWRVIRSHRAAFGVAFGVLAGVSEGTANVAAPPLIMYYLAIGVQPGALVQALNICFFAGKSAQFATLASVGGVAPLQWLVTLPLAGLAAAMAMRGATVRSRIDAATYRRWLKGALLVIALILCAQYVYTSV